MATQGSRVVGGPLIFFVTMVFLIGISTYWMWNDSNETQHVANNASNITAHWPRRHGEDDVWNDIGRAVFRRRRTVGHRYTVPAAQYPQALCLDGTPPAVYIRRTDSRKWFIFLEGYGFCYSLHDCLQRSYGAYGSTLNEPHTMEMRGNGPYFSTDARENPLLHDFNWVYVRYCDGGYFAGDVSHPVRVNITRTRGRGRYKETYVTHHQMHFRGRYIREAVVDFLKGYHGMEYATDVILGGCSSGAITTLYSQHMWRQLMSWVPNFYAFSDSGFFLDIDGYSDDKMFIYYHQNTSASLHPQCVQKFNTTPWRCFVAANVIPYYTVPVFTWQSRYDSNQLGGTCDENALTCADRFGSKLQRNVTSVMVNHSYFIDACFRHCSGFEPVLSAHGVSPLQTMYRWYYGDIVHIIQDGFYPCQECCEGAPIILSE